MENGIPAAKRKFPKELGVSISENTIRGFKVAYLEELSRKSRAKDEVPIAALPLKKRGRPLMLGERLDSKVQNYIRRTRDTGGIITTAVVIAGARGIVNAMDRTLLPEFGGHVKIDVTWAKSLLQRMNFTKRKGTTKFTMSVTDFQKMKEEFLQEVI